MELSPALLAAGARVVDLSGAFRLRTVENYKAWYKEPHTRPELLAEAVYGLPEYCRERIAAARLLVQPRLLPDRREPGDPAAGASRRGGSRRRHRVRRQIGRQRGGAQGQPEDQLLRGHRELLGVLDSQSPARSGSAADLGVGRERVQLTAQLIPIHRGILETIYFRATGVSGVEDLLAIYDRRYAAEPFVRVYNAGHVPDLHGVAHTNFCDIGVAFDAKTGRAVITLPPSTIWGKAPPGRRCRT